MAQKFLVIGHFQPTTMGLLMLIIILYFAKDEKRRTEEKDMVESSVVGSVVAGRQDGIYADIQQINQNIASEEENYLDSIDRQITDYTQQNADILTKARFD